MPASPRKPQKSLRENLNPHQRGSMGESGGFPGVLGHSGRCRGVKNLNPLGHPEKPGDRQSRPSGSAAPQQFQASRGVSGAPRRALGRAKWGVRALAGCQTRATLLAVEGAFPRRSLARFTFTRRAWGHGLPGHTGRPHAMQFRDCRSLHRAAFEPRWRRPSRASPSGAPDCAKGEPGLS